MLTNDWGDGPRGTPTVDGEFVYALGAQGTLVCVRAADGSIAWSKSMADLGGKTPNWGYTESPLILDDKVICTPGGEKGSLAAFDKKSGEVLWQSADLTTNAHYSSIVLMPHDGHVDLVQLLENQLVGVDPSNGKLLWTVPWPGQTAVIPTPIVRDNFAYCTTAYGVGCMLVEVKDGHNAEKVYDNKVMKNKHGGVILIGDHLFGQSDGVGWMWQDFATGKQLWREREALSAGAVGYADGMFYCVGEDNGDVVLVEPSDEEWKEAGRFRLEPQSDQRKERGKIWTHPVICDGRLYLRDQNLVYCFDVREGATGAQVGQGN
jgi:outer membrane protein assembly factor BamB